jgi:hypothetical protein
MSSRPTTQPRFATQLALIVGCLLAAGVLIGCGSPGGNGAEDAQPGAPPTTTADGGRAQDGPDEDDGSGETETPGDDGDGDEPSTSNQVILGPPLGPPTPMDFGVLRKVGFTRSRELTIRNDRDMTRVLSTIKVGGTDASHFELGGGCREQMKLAPNATCVLTVTFAPKGEGSRQAFFSVSAIPNGTFSFLLVGRVGPPLLPDTPTLTGPEDVVTE